MLNQKLFPFFSIGVTTYSRPSLLKQALYSIIGQTFSDFEVIVGNDYIKEAILPELLDIKDSRIRFVNHSQNLGEVGNMNALLGMSCARYFTWLGDDDLYHPDFLRILHTNLTHFNFPSCAFTSYGVIYDTSYPDMPTNFFNQGQLFSGRKFLQMYLRNQLKIIGPYGIFATELLRRMGGVESLCSAPIGIFGEYMLIVKTGLLEKVVYINAPLVYFRAHEGSWAGANKEFGFFKEAGVGLIRKSIEVLSTPELRQDFPSNFSRLLKLAMRYLNRKNRQRFGYFQTSEAISYLNSVQRQLGFLKKYSLLYLIAISSLFKERIIIIFYILKQKIRSRVPQGSAKVVRVMRKFVQSKR